MREDFCGLGEGGGGEEEDGEEETGLHGGMVRRDVGDGEGARRGVGRRRWIKKVLYFPKMVKGVLRKCGFCRKMVKVILGKPRFSKKMVKISKFCQFNCGAEWEEGTGCEKLQDANELPMEGGGLGRRIV